MLGAAVLTGYTVSVYLQEDLVGTILCRMIPAAGMIYPVVRAMLLIGFWLIPAKILEGFHFLSYAGAQTLWLVTGLVSINIEVTNEISALVYAVVMTVVIIKILLPVEQKLYGKLLYVRNRENGNESLQGEMIYICEE